MVKNSALIFLGLLMAYNVNAQSAKGEYAPSAKFPFGRVNPDFEEKLKDFAPLIGICDCKSVQRNPDQSWGDTLNTVWEWRYVINGTAIQDVNWRKDGSSASSMRVYNSDSAKWYVTYFSSNSAPPVPLTWSGAKEKDNIVLYKPQKAPNGMDGFSRLTFQNITSDGFEWRGAWVDATGSVAFPFWNIDCKKRKP